jgi:sugar/nucleoside kinase (ribokinase family)
MDRKLIVGVGSALVDILVKADDDFLNTIGAVKGGMTLVEPSVIASALAKCSRRPAIVPGGSACNTAVGIGQLGGQARFVGKCGQGEMGRLIETELRRCRVEPYLMRSEAPSGRVLSIITPDAQRTMLTFLGASSETRPEELTPSCFESAAIVHIEGYLLFAPELITAAMKSAKRAGALVSLDMASFTVVNETRPILRRLIRDHVDIVIANEDEAAAYTGSRNASNALAQMSAEAETAVVKLGARGSLIANGRRRLTIQPAGGGGTVVDTTGAGDLWASGFLFGLVNGLGLQRSGELASTCGFEVCQHVGASIPPDGWERIRQMVSRRKDGQKTGNP